MKTWTTPPIERRRRHILRACRVFGAIFTDSIANSISPTGGAGQFVFGPRQQLADLFIGRLREVFVPQSDGVKRLRREAADDHVRLAAKIVASLTRGDRDRHDD